MNTNFLSILTFTPQIPNASRLPRQNRGKMNGQILSHQNGVQSVSYMQNSQDVNQSVVTAKSSGNQQVNSPGLSMNYLLPAFLCLVLVQFIWFWSVADFLRMVFVVIYSFYVLGSFQFSCLSVMSLEVFCTEKCWW